LEHSEHQIENFAQVTHFIRVVSSKNEKNAGKSSDIFSCFRVDCSLQKGFFDFADQLPESKRGCLDPQIIPNRIQLFIDSLCGFLACLQHFADNLLLGHLLENI
jgi:hypothetical protein